MTKSASDPDVVAETLALLGERRMRFGNGVDTKKFYGSTPEDPMQPLMVDLPDKPTGLPSLDQLKAEYDEKHTRRGFRIATLVDNGYTVEQAKIIAESREQERVAESNLQPLMVDLPDKPTGLPSLDQLKAEYDARHLVEHVARLQDDVRRLDHLVSGFIGLFKKLGAIDPDGGAR